MFKTGDKVNVNKELYELIMKKLRFMCDNFDKNNPDNLDKDIFEYYVQQIEFTTDLEFYTVDYVDGDYVYLKEEPNGVYPIFIFECDFDFFSEN